MRKKRKKGTYDIQSIIMSVLTVLTIVTSVTMGLLLYNRYEMAMRQVEVQDANTLMVSTVDSIEHYLLNMRQISNALNYNVIQQLDVSSVDFNRELSLLYEMNKDKIQSIVLYDDAGNLITAEPVTAQKENVEITEQSWFVDRKSVV